MEKTERNRLRDVRKAAGLTVTDVANRLGATTASVSRWENGKQYVSERTYRALADIYNVSVDVLRDPPYWMELEEALLTRQNETSPISAESREPKVTMSRDQVERVLSVITKLHSLTVDELSRVEGYIDALIESRV